jgi:hypothetical protein
VILVLDCSWLPPLRYVAAVRCFPSLFSAAHGPHCCSVIHDIVFRPLVSTNIAEWRATWNAKAIRKQKKITNPDGHPAHNYTHANQKGGVDQRRVHPPLALPVSRSLCPFCPPRLASAPPPVRITRLTPSLLPLFLLYPSAQRTHLYIDASLTIHFHLQCSR